MNIPVHPDIFRVTCTNQNELNPINQSIKLAQNLKKIFFYTSSNGINQSQILLCIQCLSPVGRKDKYFARNKQFKFR